MTTWRVTVRNPDGTRGEQIADFLRLELDARLMGAGGAFGNLQIDVPASHRAAEDLEEPGAGLILESLPATGYIEWSGDVVDSERTYGRRARVSVIAESDDAVMADDQAFPVASTDVAAGSSTLFSAAEDVRTGSPETIWLGLVAANLGPAAAVARRRSPWLQVPTSLGRGTSTTYRARMTDLAEIGRKLLIPAGLAWRVVHSDPDVLAVQVWAPSQPSGARYGAANLRDLRRRRTAPKATEWIVGGAGTGSSRLFTRQSVPNWGRRRRVQFLDSTSSGTAAEALADVASAIAETSATEQVSWQLVPAADAPTFGAGLRLGDVAEVILPNRPAEPVVDVVRRVELRIEGKAAPQITVTVGYPDPDPEQTTAAQVRADTAATVRR